MGTRNLKHFQKFLIMDYRCANGGKRKKAKNFFIAYIYAKSKCKEKQIKKIYLKIMKWYIGNIEPEPNTIFVFGSNPEGRHGAGAAKVARERFGAIYGRGEGIQGHAYAIPTKDLRVKENRGYRSITKENIISSIRKFYAYAVQHPELDFKIAYRNVEKYSLNGYTGIEMIKMFHEAASDYNYEIPDNVYFSQEWWNYYYKFIKQ